MIKNIIFLAPPASGKGTQAELLKEKYGMLHISTGDLLREASSMDNEFGRNLKEILKSGILVSDDIVTQLLRDKINSISDVGFILDGFPRNISQANQLDDILGKIQKSIDYVIYLDVPKEELERRITGRRICKSCGKIYNIYQDNISLCTCGGELYQRSDDNYDSFIVRYDEYLDKTQPLIDYYEHQNKLFRVDGCRKVNEIFNQISQILEGDLDD